MTTKIKSTNIEANALVLGGQEAAQVLSILRFAPDAAEQLAPAVENAAALRTKSDVARDEFHLALIDAGVSEQAVVKGDIAATGSKGLALVDQHLELKWLLKEAEFARNAVRVAIADCLAENVDDFARAAGVIAERIDKLQQDIAEVEQACNAFDALLTTTPEIKDRVARVGAGNKIRAGSFHLGDASNRYHAINEGLR